MLIKALVADETSGATCSVLNSAAFQDFYGEIEAWRAWVQEAGKENKGAGP